MACTPPAGDAISQRSGGAGRSLGKRRSTPTAKKCCARSTAACAFSPSACEALKVVSEKPSDPNKVYFGAWVTIEDEDGKQSRYRIVGPDELDLKLGLISIDSPLARALIGKALDAEVRVQTPTGEQFVYIVAIDYP